MSQMPNPGMEEACDSVVAPQHDYKLANSSFMFFFRLEEW